MDIFVGNLPGKTSVLEFRKLIGTVGSGRFRILRKQVNGRSYCYGHAALESSEPGKEIISRLDGLEFGGSHLHVRPYLHRSEQHERRCLKIFSSGWSGVNRRRGERRNH